MKILEIYKNKLRFKNYSKRTIEVYSHYFEQFLINEKIKDAYQVSTNDIVCYLEHFDYTSISQQNQIIGSLKLFARFILNKKDIHLKKIERPKKEKKLPRVIDKNHLLKCIDAIENKKHKAIIALAYSVGLRVSEVINLKIEDVDSERMIINIRQAKGRKDRIVPLSMKILSILRDYVRKFRPVEYLFNGQFSAVYSTSSCNNIVKKYIGEKYHFHLLRHSSFTSMLESGIDLRIIQSIAGHNSSKTTEIYTHVSNNILSNVALPI